MAENLDGLVRAARDLAQAQAREALSIAASDRKPGAEVAAIATLLVFEENRRLRAENEVLASFARLVASVHAEGVEGLEVKVGRALQMVERGMREATDVQAEVDDLDG